MVMAGASADRFTGCGRDSDGSSFATSGTSFASMLLLSYSSLPTLVFATIKVHVIILMLL